MAPSKGWMDLVGDRLNDVYLRGVEEFLDYAFKKTGRHGEIRCPCVKCSNTYSATREVVGTHLKVYGIIRNYTFWYHHGERVGESESNLESVQQSEDEPSNEMHDILRDLYPEFCGQDTNDMDTDIFASDIHKEEPNEEANKFYRLLRDFEQPLYQGSKSSKLSCLVKLLHIKSLGRWSNESFTMLLQLLKDELLPQGSNLPQSYYDAKKVIQDLGLSYKKIDACVNNCMLYWKEDERLDFCKICGYSRWKTDKYNGEDKVKTNGKRIPKKILRYFPLKPRLQRLFMSTKTASLMRWHKDKRVDDGVMRHPADSMAWISFDKLHLNFASDSRNVRLGFASDGFQPFANSKMPYSVWPVLLIPYNLPPWMCMKQSNFILLMLIPGPEGPGDAIDIYLQPLVEELRELWETGIDTFDAYAQQNFKLHVVLLWTINDFPAYGNLSGWSTKGKLACPCCNKDTCWMRLANGGKQCYMGHRQYLPLNHKWRNDNKSFDGTRERGLPPKPLSGDDILDQVKNLEGVILTKALHMKKAISHDGRGDNWNKKSIFFDLPYWRTLLLRHNLDVVHIEKNICDNILGTIMNIKGKTKDSIKTRLDLQALNIRPELHSLKVPDGFSSNISLCVNMKESKISRLKIHDCHVLLLHILPLAMRGLLPKVVYEPLVELSLFFSHLGAKALKTDVLEQLEKQIPITLCKLERIFPLSFFDIMVHLPMHLASEAKIGGPVQYHWMYPIERALYSLKSSIRNRACVEGSIAEAYIANECMTLCSRYLNSIETKFNRMERNYNGSSNKNKGGLSIFSKVGHGLGVSKTRVLDTQEWEQAHIYVLKNCDEVQPYIEYDIFKLIHIVAWLHKNDPSQKMRALLSLSRGPARYVTSFYGYIVNGYRFHTEYHDQGLRTQNSGVVVIGDIGDEVNNIDYYGVLTEIIQLQYLCGFRFFLFLCYWWDVYDLVRWVKIDEYGDNIHKGWHYVIKAHPRDSYDIPLEEDIDPVDLNQFGEAYQADESINLESGETTTVDANDQISWKMMDIEPQIIDISSTQKKRKHGS
ncbi:uncharacterized protein LOC131178387 [Hevea brasiliensis]|uniref:uncharacterized protein LOC131178387 n=1 Tax=Hevea brasiliensis TaxID=3981 RepID=UPI0025F56EE6|nr:uncharacterized protein LOC131178387 [Hevea brasiliensis]